MPGDSDYLSTHEAALAVVATAMKKARLPLHALFVNSFMGGVLFTSGGMLHVLVQSNCRELFATNPGLAQLLQGLLYPIGLFYVVILGVDLFNSNILFFSTGLVRGAVSIVDLVISWMVSWWMNLVGNIFACFVIFHYSHVTSTDTMIYGSAEIVKEKASATFVQTLLKGIAGNFFVSLAIYLQLMAKPLHVKFFLMAMPVFCFVSMGFTHSVADMYMLIIGSINHAPVPVRVLAWKVFLPGVIGNIIGGSFFGVVVTWYLHLYLVEHDRKALKLPEYDTRDEQPDLNMDSRVVRQNMNRAQGFGDYAYPTDEKEALKEGDYFSSTDQSHVDYQVHGIVNSGSGNFSPLDKVETNLTRGSLATNLSSGSNVRSPKNVYPVYGMGPPLKRERTIASGRNEDELNSDNSDYYVEPVEDFDDAETPSAEYIGSQIRNVLTSRSSANSKGPKATDIESQRSSTSRFRRPSGSSLARRISSGLIPGRLSQVELNRRLSRSGITHKAAKAANEVAGTAELETTSTNRETSNNKGTQKERVETREESGKSASANTGSNPDTSLDDSSVQVQEYSPA